MKGINKDVNDKINFLESVLGLNLRLYQKFYLQILLMRNNCKQFDTFVKICKQKIISFLG